MEKIDVNKALKEIQYFFNFDGIPTQEMHDKIIYYLDFLCSKKAIVKIKILGRTVCMICHLRVSPEDKYYTFQPCRCYQSVHLECFAEKVWSCFSKNSKNELVCNSCKRRISLEEIKNALGITIFNKMMKDLEEKRKNEERDILIALNEQKKLRDQLADELKYECEVCGLEKPIGDFRTLDCTHRFCSECLIESFSLGIKEKTIKKEDFKCFNCKKKFNVEILKAILPKEDFELLEKILLVRLDANKDEVLVKCPKADCINFIYLPINSKITHHICEVCGNDFCVRGCVKPHRPRTCEEHLIFMEEERKAEEKRRLEEIEKIKEEARRQEEKRKYDEWKKENEQAEAKFREFVQQEKIKMCPKCQVMVQRISGCNYIRCRCSYEFCYVCTANYPGHKSLCGH